MTMEGNFVQLPQIHESLWRATLWSSHKYIKYGGQLCATPNKYMTIKGNSVQLSIKILPSRATLCNYSQIHKYGGQLYASPPQIHDYGGQLCATPTKTWVTMEGNSEQLPQIHKICRATLHNSPQIHDHRGQICATINKNITIEGNSVQLFTNT